MVDHNIGVGGDVLTQCNKCELELWHTVMAKVGGLVKKVKCNTCKTEHMLRGQAKLAAHKRTAAKPPQTVLVKMKDRIPHKPWSEMISGRQDEEAPAYSISVQLTKNGLVRHPSFGLGVVTELSDDRKRATVLFEAGHKVLAANKA